MDFVSVEVGSEEAGVAVGSVEGLVDGDVWEVTEVAVEGVVLSVGEVEVLSGVFVLSVFSQHSLENEEAVVVGVGPSWGLEEDANVDVGHLVVSHGQHGGGEIWLVSVLDFGSGGAGKSTEMLLGELDELLVGDVTGTDDDDVGTDVVGSMEVDDLFLGDGADVFSYTEDRLAHHVVSVGGVVGGLDGGFHLVLLGLDAFSEDGLSFGFDLVGVVDGVGEHVSEDLNSLSEVLFEDGHAVRGVFPGGVGVELAADVFDAKFELGSGSVLGSLEVEMFQEMGDTAVFDGFLSGSALNEDGDSGEFSRPVFGGDSDTIAQGG